MGHLKKICMAALLLTGGLTMTSCTDYQDEIDALDYRIRVLEERVKEINNNIKAMQKVVSATESGDYITGVSEVEGGYVINFHKNGPIYIMDGEDGQDGQDAQSPDITIAKDPTDGEYYWMLNGEWLLANGQKIRANGKDGKDGKDAVSPQVRINPTTGMWEISVDGGVTWTSTGTAAQGKNGKDGKDGNQFITLLYYEASSDGEFLIITTKGGTFRIPIV